MEIHKGRGVFHSSCRHPVVGLFLGVLAVVGSEIRLAAQPQSPASGPSSLPAWCLPPAVKSDLDQQFQRLREEKLAHTDAREYEKAQDLEKADSRYNGTACRTKSLQNDIVASRP